MITFAVLNLKEYNLEIFIKFRYFFRDKCFVFEKNNFYLLSESINIYMEHNHFFHEKQKLIKLYT